MKTISTLLAKITIIFIVLISSSLGPLSSQDLIPSQWPNLVGYWQFQDTNDLTKATVGSDLQLIGQHQYVDGAAYGDTAIRIDTGSYYKVYHGISANGGGDSVNQYTLMFDFKVLSLDKWHAFFQTDTTNNNDGECFIKHWGDSIAGSIGVGYTEYSSDSILPNEWYRLIISINLGHFYNYYLNGVLLHTGDTSDIGIDDRFALTEAILFFADNNQEDDTIDIASIALFDTCLTPIQIAQIGTIEPCIANPPIVNLGNDTMILTMLSDSLILNAGTGFKSYIWSTGDTNNTIIAYKNPNIFDTIWVKVIDMNDCETVDSIIIEWAPYESINEFGKDQFQIYPNPSDGNISILLSQDAFTISVFNVSGQKLREFKNLKQGKHNIHLSDLPSGLYFIEIQTNKGNSTHKFMIE